ncbi:protein kinase domain-containing protein [Legionella spiritensis]|uniref:Protein kinase domain-containing protein n=1 Tax=Legionella spiritensis TaxID=452 RepID=A0A0W0YWV5_LEGSP|nr:protein kinase [Legionella spiritensis]KTD61405.1 putative protein kinase [Legionella spiritensis]SNV33477.1 Serine/threonine protein kinase [Legionella spiritensis]
MKYIRINPEKKMSEAQKAILEEYFINRSLRFSGAGKHSYEINMPDGRSIKKGVRLKYSLLMNDLKESRRSIEILDKKIGSGAFGSTIISKGVIKVDENMRYKVRSGEEKKRVVKRIPLNGKSTKKRVRKEAERAGKGSSVLHCKAALFSPKNAYLIMRNAPGMELYELMEKMDEGKITLNTLQMLKISLAIIEAVNNIHQRGILHLDIKPENIMVDPTTLKVTIIDFGLSVPISKKRVKNPRGTPEFISPELAFANAVSPACDVFSLGQTLAEFWNNRPSLPDTEDSDAYMSELFFQYLQDESIWQFTGIKAPDPIKGELSDLLWRLCRFHCEDRIGLDEAALKTGKMIDFLTNSESCQDTDNQHYCNLM